jgi:hypothetical protein
MPDPLIILAALLCGMASRAIGMPALIGYLAAGFVLHELNVSGGDCCRVLAEMGITLLLFSYRPEAAAAGPSRRAHLGHDVCCTCWSRRSSCWRC